MRNQQENPNGPCRTLVARSLAACFLVIGLLAGAAPSKAQLNETGTINGTVTDQTGAVIPGAIVTIINVGTGTQTPVKSNGSGDFSAVGLNVGTYSVKVAIDGFETYEKDNFYVGSTQTYTVNVSLKPGSTQQSVVVQADSVHVETGTNEISTEITGEETEKLALGGRNYQQLATLMPGVTNLSAANSMATGGYVANNSVSVNGMGRSSVFYTLDGIWNEETGDLLTNTVTPDPEAIDQVKVLQNNYSVQYNMMGGAVFMVHTKSGTSSFHGQAWYFYRDGKFNALNYFVLPTGDLNPPFHWNIGGVGVGGPLTIPHLFNTHRDKTFFYINGQYVDQITSTVAYATDPTQDEVNGIFPAEIHDPVTQNDYPVSPGGPSGQQWTIPQAKIVPAAQALLKALVPLPNTPPTPCPPTNCDVVQRSTNNFLLTNPIVFKQLNVMGKVDHIISPRLRLTAEYFREGVRHQLASASRMGSTYPYNWDIFYNNDSAGQIHLSEVISGTMLNQISVAMDRYVVTHTYGGVHLASQVPGFSETLAYPSTIIGLPGQWLPDITFSSGWTKFGTNSTDTQYRTAYLAETLTDNWTWLRGKHSFAAGGTFLLGRSRVNAQADNTTGTFNFNGSATGTPIADFLVGAAATYVQGNTVVRKKLTYPIYSPYAEDQWKVLPRLTLTGGLRYSYMPFANADQGYATTFNPNSFDPAATPIVNQDGSLVLTPNYNPLNGLAYNGFSGVPFNMSNAHQNYFSPSAGFAWDMYGDGKSSLRGGFAINYLKSGSSSDCEQNCIGLPAVQQIELSFANFPNPLNGKTTVPTATSIYGEDQHGIQAAKIYSYSLSVQQQFGANWIAQIAEAGVAGRSLPLELNINQPKPVPGYSYNPVLNLGVSNAYAAPYKGWSAINYATSTGIANWNALELSLRHPVGHNIVFRSAFTWAHGLADVPSQQGYADENSGVQDAYNPMKDYGNTQLNQRLNFSSAIVYKLPWFTPGGWSKTAFGGWQFSAVVAFQSGVSYSAGLSTTGHALATRPNMDPTMPLQRYKGDNFTTNKIGAVGPFISTCSFTVPGEGTPCSPGSEVSPYFNGTFGNAPVGNIMGPGAVINNVALFKSFPIKDWVTMRLRGELFNMVNHPNFDGQDLNVGDANFGYYTQAADPREAEFAIEVQW
ncbi:MAG TPA: carboxypeptidase regulatory-like domain-containing protein [Acidobacteriaceae bacterium]|nr:carboxypeptidase regulatory-like domain-containing protein [Acidobacteriaceae bacterium]